MAYFTQTAPDPPTCKRCEALLSLPGNEYCGDCDLILTPKITRENVLHRINEAIHTIIHHWDEWEADARQDAQREQDHDAYFFAMEAQLECVLLGMIFDEKASPEEDTPCDE